MAATPQMATQATSALTEHPLRIRRLGIDTYQEPVVFLREDSHVCRSEGFESQSRVELRRGDKRIIATLNVVRAGGLIELAEDQAGLSEAAWRSIGAAEQDSVCIGHPAPVESFSHVRAKVFGHEFTAPALEQVIDDIGAGRYSNIEMAAFITACAADRLNTQETIALTQAMVATGSRLTWSQRPIVDKHCVGGLPGNRTTLIVVPIIAALGLTIPKTSSRAITSPAGTADTMETLAPVALDVPLMRRVVEREGGCIIWGGAVALSPVDDVLIRVERPLDLDGDAQLVASVMSKKAAAGSTHVLIDVPVGPTAKVRSESAGHTLAWRLIEVGRALGLQVDVVLTDGTQPVGYGIGPALEARDVLAVLRNEAAAPGDLRDRAVMLAGRIVELAQLRRQTLAPRLQPRCWPTDARGRNSKRSPKRKAVFAFHRLHASITSSRRPNRATFCASTTGDWPVSRNWREHRWSPRPAWTCTSKWVPGLREGNLSTRFTLSRLANCTMRSTTRRDNTT